MRRRTFLAGLAATPLLAAARPATVPGGYATVVLSPHQDDETLRLSAYIQRMTDRGDSVALVCATDGAATSVGPRLGLTPAEVTRIRDREQAEAWAALTGGRGDAPVKLGLPDGAATAPQVYEATAATLDGMVGRPEVYVATYPPEGPFAYLPAPGAGDAHPDHVACVEAARMLAADGVTVRFAVHPYRTDASGTAVYDMAAGEHYRLEAAVDAYRTIGQRSVPAQFDTLLAARGRTVVSR